MQDPRESMRQLADQMGWLSQMMSGEFWNQVQDGLDAARPPTAPPRQGAGAGPGPGPGRAPGRPTGPLGGTFPPLEIYLTAAEVVVCAAVPGAGPEGIALSLASPGELVLEVFAQPRGMGAGLVRERFAGYCTRTVTLPASVHPHGAVARLADGLLEVRLQRLEPGAGDTGVSLLQIRPEEPAG
jgi:HSP20 family molecular chaperone IbpA